MLSSIPLKLFIPEKKKSIYDNGIFQLHYRFTVIILVVSSVVISTKQFFGDPIKCIGDRHDFNAAIDIYCWMHGTYTLKNPQFRNLIGGGARNIEPGDVEVHHQYYQWVCLVLILQAFFFAVPYYLWRVWEGNRMEMLSNELNTASKKSDESKNSLKYDMVAYFLEDNGNTAYMIRFYICEFLNFLNVIGQIFFLDAFLGMSFLNYGSSVMSYYFNKATNIELVNPMEEIFPKTTKCSYSQYGPSGSKQKYDFLCILSLNIINEKLYILLWFWFITLAVLSGGIIVYRFIYLCWPSVRLHAITSLLRTVPKHQLRILLKKLSYGDWFVLSQLGKNVPVPILKELINNIYRDVESKSASI